MVRVLKGPISSHPHEETEAELQLLLAEWMLQRPEQLDVVSSIQKNKSEGFSLLLAGLGQMKQNETSDC